MCCRCFPRCGENACQGCQRWCLWVKHDADEKSCAPTTDPAAHVHCSGNRPNKIVDSLIILENMGAQFGMFPDAYAFEVVNIASDGPVVTAISFSWIEAPYDWTMYALPPALPCMPSWWPLNMTCAGLPSSGRTGTPEACERHGEVQRSCGADVVFTAPPRCVDAPSSTPRRPDRLLLRSCGPIPQTSSRNDGGGEFHVDPLGAAKQVAGRPQRFTDGLDAPRSGHELAKYCVRLHPRELCAQA